MQLVRKLALGVATVSVAFGAGHLVQSGDDKALLGSAVQAKADDGDAQARDRREEVEPARAATILSERTDAILVNSVTGAVDKTLPPWASGSQDDPSVIMADATVAMPSKPISVASVDPAVAEDTACAPTLTVTPRDNAMLDVLLFAPCAKDSRVILRHAGLAVSAHTTATGALSIMVPALASAGVVSVTLKDGTTAESSAPVEMAGLRRFAVQWLSDDAIQMQIYENGAAFGAPGNVSAARPQGAGTLAALGDNRADLPLMSEIYTFPSSPIPVQVTLEAEVTQGNCGHEVLGQTLESMDGTVKTSDITLTMPGCEAVGDILVLNNLAGDTTLAKAE